MTAVVHQRQKRSHRRPSPRKTVGIPLLRYHTTAGCDDGPLPQHVSPEANDVDRPMCLRPMKFAHCGHAVY